MAAPQGPQVGAYELYRRSSVGVALSDVLDEFISNRQIEPQLALKIISNFDKAVAEALTEKVKNRCNFKVSAGLCADAYSLYSSHTLGSSRYISLLR
jgi:transcription initiation factor TFIIA small subunit